MTNFGKYIEELTIEAFVDSMIRNCDGCPAFPCKARGDESFGDECAKELEAWCRAEAEDNDTCEEDACDIIFD